MLQIEWVGTDGSVWDLINGDVSLSNAGITGLGMPLTFDTTRQTALYHGQTLQSWRLEPREVFLPLLFTGDSFTDVEGIQRNFWHSMALGEYGSLNVTDGNGYTRSLELRLVSDNGLAYNIDPYSDKTTRRSFGLSMVADNPWWQGEEVSTTFGLGTEGTATFFGNGSSATPFYIVKSTGGTDAALVNLGDMPAWITWTITGAMTSFDLEVDGHHIAGAITVDVGETLTIETSPLSQIAYLNDGTKVTRYLTSADFAPVPASASPVPIGIDVVGTGNITAAFRPQFMRAF